MDINNVEEGEGKGWNYNDEPKTTEEDELLPQLTVHSLKEAPTTPLCESFQLMKYSRIGRLKKPQLFSRSND
jgi:hypothetical protein